MAQFYLVSMRGLRSRRLKCKNRPRLYNLIRDHQMCGIGDNAQLPTIRRQIRDGEMAQASDSVVPG